MLPKGGSEATDIILAISDDLIELENTIKIVEGNPARFKITGVEIESRKSFISNSKRVLDSFRKQDKYDSASKPDKKEAKNSHNSLLTERQQLIMEQQNSQMQEVSVTIGGLKEIARVMGDELDDQGRLLDEVDTHVESTKNRLDDGLKRMGEFIKANSGENI
jgi:hypothetical protein